MTMSTHGTCSVLYTGSEDYSCTCVHIISLKMSLLLGYMLEPDASKRPDIYQVCHVVHHLRGFNNPVANVFVSLYVYL